jgi:phosphate uptake regulator
MCGFTASVINVRSLTSRQKRKLKAELKRRKASVLVLLKDIDKAIETVDKKLTRKKSRR